MNIELLNKINEEVQAGRYGAQPRGVDVGAA